MLELPASKILIVDGVEDDPLMRARAERLRTGIPTSEVRHVTDEELCAIVKQQRAQPAHNGMRADFEPIVIFNRYRFDDDDEERRRRTEAYPELDWTEKLKLNGYGGFDWRDSGSAAYRERTGLVCQPAYALHTIIGCHFRCAYCTLSRIISIMLNVEDYVSRLDEWLERCPNQTLFQNDNYTDNVCFEPEYGAAKLLIESFARKPGKALELYVGKSDRVDCLLDYDHRGHTVCCWSLSAQTQSTAFEWRSAPMSARIEAMRKCQEAGYPVRVRLSPILPVKDWRDENREMIELLFRDVTPDVITMETIRFLSYERMSELFDLSLLDEAFLEVMKAQPDPPEYQGCELPDDYRQTVYDFVISQIERVRPQARFAFCREKRAMWTRFADRFARHGQDPDHYMCNCGPRSAPVTAVG